MSIRLSFVGAAVAALAVVLPLSASASGAASAGYPCDNAATSTPFFTGTQQITEPDSGTAGDWANDSFTENITAWLGSDGTTFCASGTTSNGTFTTTGPNSPGAGAALAAGITGTFTGGEEWIFPGGTATTTTSSTAVFTADNSASDGQFSNWQSQLFSQTAGASTYSFTYVTANNGTWTNADPASNPSGNVGDIGSVVDTTTHTGYPTIQTAVNAATAGDTIALSSDVTVTSEVTIAKPLTLDGAGHTLFAQINNSANDNANNAGLGIIGVNGDVTLENLTVDGTGSTKIHGINIFDAGNVALNNVTSKNNTKSGITVNGANVTANNVTTKSNAWGGINADLEADATNPATVLTITGTSVQSEIGPDIWQDNNSKNVVVNVNGQYASETYTSAPGITGTIWGLNSATVNNSAELTAALANPLIATITFGSDIVLSAELDITRAVTIDGVGHAVTTTSNSGSVIQVTANNVTLKNLVENGSGTTGNRGINLYKVTGILLNDVTAEHNSKDGIVVNGSTVTLTDIVTLGNGWDGIDVDQGSGITTPASLTVNGTSVHTETGDAIKVDDTTKNVSVTDANNQYSFTDNGNTRDYVLNVTRTKTTSDTTQTTTSGGVSVSIDIPSGTIVTGDATWDGVINPPTATTTTVSLTGFTTVVTSAISIGSNDSDLTFSAPVRLLFAGQAGKLAGSYDAAGAFTEITSSCNSDSSSTLVNGAAFPAGGACKIDVGSDLVVYTEHFSTFVTFSETATGGGSFGGGSSSSGASSGGGGSIAITTPVVTQVITTTAPASNPGQVLGAAAFNFAADLSTGKTNGDVTALQQFLISEGFTIKAGATGYFGAQTKAAVIAFQKANGLPQTGYVGPLTRAILNKGSINTQAETSTSVSGSVSSSGLTTNQVSAIVSLLNSFGADSATIAKVQAALLAGH